MAALLLLTFVGADRRGTPVPTNLIGGPYARLLADSTDLGPARAARVQLTAALTEGTTPVGLTRWAGDHGLSVRWRAGDPWAVVEGPPDAVAGALDVALQHLQMKKNRPGFLLTVLVQPEKVDEIATIILRETSAFGIRLDRMQRMKLRREFRDVETPYGTVRIKVGFLGDEIVQAAPEYESCREVALRAGVSVRDVHLAAWIGSVPSPTAGS